ncbi:MAG: substrate-binding domain-containing protein [Treponema sp.]|jgi:ABC-type sugar transport system substrate-binding protein|nr:substrate-binding domain-containing protein [Treponema sp.]
MNKRILVVAAVLLLAAILAPTVFAGGQSSSSTGGKKIVIGYIAKNTTDPFHGPLNTAARKEMDALKANGKITNYFFYDGLTNPVTQVELMDTAINAGCTHIILLPAEAAGSSPVLTKAKEKNIPVVVVNSMTNNTPDLAAGYVGSNDVQAGEMMAKFVQSKAPNGGGYGHIMGVIGNSAQIQRGQGIHNIMDKDSKWKMLDEQGADWQAERAVNFSMDWLSKYGDQLNAIICDNDDMSSAAQNYVNSRNRRDIICIGVDGNAGPLNMVKNGDLQATVYQDGVGQVLKGIELLVKVANGESIPKTTMIDFVMITKDNVNQYLK